MSYVTITISHVSDVKSVSAESFVGGESHVVEASNFGDLLQEITRLMDEPDFNCERILFYTKDGARFDFGYDERALRNGDYFNVAIIRDDPQQLWYAHQGPM